MTRYYEPKSIDEAVQVLADEGAAALIFAGGTDLMPAVRSGLSASPPVIVNIKRIPELRGIRVEDRDGAGPEVIIGAATTIADILFSEVLGDQVPALPAVAQKMAGPQIRNMGTVGGNIANASPAGDLINPLLALDARIELARWENGAVAHRQLDLKDFFTGPGQTLRGSGELLTAIRLERPARGFRFRLEKFGRRPAMNCSVTTVGVGAVVGEGGVLTGVRVVFGALAPTPLRGRKTEAVLEGKIPDEAVLRAVEQTAREEVNPLSDVRGGATFRQELAGVLARRAAARLGSSEGAGSAATEPVAAPESACGAHEVSSALRFGVVEDALRTIAFTLNGESVRGAVSPLKPLIEMLRDDLELLGTKLGCGEGECGSCTVIVDGDSVNGCLYLAVDCDGRDVMTIEGLARRGVLDRIQQSFVAHGAVQCGFCTPGMILQAWWLLHRGIPLTEENVKRGIEGNLCRCTGYVKIVEAIQALAEESPRAEGVTP